MNGLLFVRTTNKFVRTTNKFVRTTSLSAVFKTIPFCMMPIPSGSAIELNTTANGQLTDEEWDVFQQIRSAKRKREFLAGRLAAKKVLKSAPFRLPGNPSVVRTHSGAPLISGHKTLSLSITHSSEYALSAAWIRPVGVDLERMEPRPASLLRHFFSKEEQRLFANLGKGATMRLANQLWCRKEAVSKVLGLGGALPFHTMDCTHDSLVVLGSRIVLRSAVVGDYAAAVAYEMGT